MQQLPPIPGTMKVTFHHTVGGKAMSTNHYYKVGVDGGVLDPASLGDALKAKLTTFGKPAMNPGHSIVGMSIMRVDNWDLAGVEYTAGFPIVGAKTLNTLVPHQVCAVVAHKTGLRGRSFEGRTYWPGIDMNMVSGDTLVPAYVTLLQTLFDSLVSPITAGGAAVPMNLAVASFFHQNALRTPYGVSTAVQTNIIRPRVGTQRRRLN